MMPLSLLFPSAEAAALFDAQRLLRDPLKLRRASVADMAAAMEAAR